MIEIQSTGAGGHDYVTLLSRKAGDNEIVLAFTGWDEVQPFVTWQRGEGGECYWGHYYRRLDEAYKDYQTRRW